MGKWQQQRIVALEAELAEAKAAANAFATSILSLRSSPPMSLERAMRFAPDGVETHEHIANLVREQMEEYQRRLAAAEPFARAIVQQGPSHLVRDAQGWLAYEESKDV